MTKLAEWLAGVTLITAVWFCFLSNDILLNRYDIHSLLLPVYGVIGFGVYSLVVILYRVFTFNDCPEAAKELKMEIEMAKKDLAAKGFKFD
ncbi:dolichol-phosphate mannosyltransferase subunit 3 [Trichonephila inaurata madagascariensis]|uniref:Dolichol-phosphate mannosyltransferase subunit 3 n=1 Tax=Trichonephila inaurata madagascariensis TaxID=2747483 RepID=A0A8X6XRL2_9ARAC|nr:dolichol-phosphate mannosyltransferase subunit 3 [Trichonephila inaurata madagascariensis]